MSNQNSPNSNSEHVNTKNRTLLARPHSRLLRAQASMNLLCVLARPEGFHTAWRTRDAKLCTRGIFSLQHFTPQTMHNLYIMWLQCDALQMNCYKVCVLQQPNKICFCSCVQGCEGTSSDPVAIFLPLGRFSCHDIADQPATCKYM